MYFTSTSFIDFKFTNLADMALIKTWCFHYFVIQLNIMYRKVGISIHINLHQYSIWKFSIYISLLNYTSYSFTLNDFLNCSKTLLGSTLAIPISLKIALSGRLPDTIAAN